MRVLVQVWKECGNVDRYTAVLDVVAASTLETGAIASAVDSLERSIHGSLQPLLSKGLAELTRVCVEPFIAIAGRVAAKAAKATLRWFRFVPYV